MDLATAPYAGTVPGVSRIRPLSAAEAGPLARAVYAYSRREFGRVPEPLAVTAHQTGLMVGMCAFEMATERARRVPKHLKELAEMKAAVMAGCEWCVDFGAFLVDRDGMPPEQMRELSRHRESAVFDELERLVLDYAEGMTSTPVAVSDELVAELRRHFADAQMGRVPSVSA